MAAADKFPPGGVGGVLSEQITATAQQAGIDVTVEVTRFGEDHTVQYIYRGITVGVSAKSMCQKLFMSFWDPVEELHKVFSLIPLYYYLLMLLSIHYFINYIHAVLVG